MSEQRRSRWRRGVVLGWAALVAGGCTPVGEGEVRVLVTGEAGAQRGYPASLMEDGWTVRFERYLVALGDFTLTSARGEQRVLDTHLLVDLQKGQVELGRLEGLTAGRWSVGFRVSPPEERTLRPDGHVTAEDAERMRAAGHAYWLEGEAVKPQVGTVRFQLGLPVSVQMVECTNGVDGTLGVVVPENSTTEAEVTVHVEHLLYDKLGTHRGVRLRFDAFAAAAGEDGVVTLEDLATQDLLDLRGIGGGPLVDARGQPVVYEPGAYDVRTLQEFVLRSVIDQAHLNGGGVCQTGSAGASR